MVFLGRSWTWLVLAVVVLVPAASAEPADFRIEGTVPLELTGAIAAAGPSPALLLQGTSGEASWRVDAARLHVVHVEYWQEEPGRLATRAAPHSGVRTTDHVLDAAHLAVTTRLDGFTSLFWSDAAAVDVTVQGEPAHGDVASDRPVDARVFRLGAPLSVTAPSMEDALVAGTVLGRPVPFRYEVPTGDLHLQAVDARHALVGALEGYVTGAVIEATHREGLLRLELAERVETRPGSVYVPDEGWTGPGTHTERVNHYVQIRTADGRLVAETMGAPVAVFVPEFDLGLDGRLALAGASGGITFADGTRRGFADDGLVLAGTFRADLVGTDAPTRAALVGSGDVAYLRARGVAEAFPYGAVAATAVGVAALLGAALMAWKAAGGAGITLFSRVAKGDVLDHETRATIYDLVRAEPGCTPNDLVGATGIGWSTVMYHLSVLERNDLLVAMKDGRYRRYFDRQSGRFANGRKRVVSALKNETTAAIAQVIRDEPGQVQRRLAERFGLAASSVHWHVTRLADAGLVEKRRVGQRVELFPGPSWAVMDDEPHAEDAPVQGPVLPKDRAAGSGADAPSV